MCQRRQAQIHGPGSLGRIDVVRSGGPQAFAARAERLDAVRSELPKKDAHNA
jgi:hypothetical protein